jgi:hypothetical protein
MPSKKLKLNTLYALSRLILPDSLMYVYLHRIKYFPQFPSSLREIHISDCGGNFVTCGLFKEGLEVLSLGNAVLAGCDIPQTVMDLTLTHCKTLINLNQLFPRKLKKLTYVWTEEMTFKHGDLPESLHYLLLDGSMHLSSGIIPSRVHTLVLLGYTRPIEAGIIPDSVSELFLPNMKQPLVVLPPRLTKLRCHLNALNGAVLPNSIRIIEEIDMSKIPPNLQINLPKSLKEFYAFTKDLPNHVRFEPGVFKLLPW